MIPAPEVTRVERIIGYDKKHKRHQGRSNKENEDT